MPERVNGVTVDSGGAAPSRRNDGRMGRRSFLRRAAAATAGAAAFPCIIPSSAFGADGATAPSERIALGFIGLGKMGRGSHLPFALGRRHVHVVALCDVESRRLEESKALTENRYAEALGQGRYSGCDTYRDFRELLARPDIDAVFVVTPDHWHAIPCIEAAKAGKDIYCEKPMTRTIAEGRAVVEAVRRYGRVFQTGSQQRSDYDGRFRRAAELVRNGALGDLQSIDIGVGGPASDAYDLPPEPVPPTLDWDLWQGPAPARPYSPVLCPPMEDTSWARWRYFSDYSGGGLSDFGAHHFDIAQWALGMDDSGPVEVLPQGREHPRMTFVYANGVPMYHGGDSDCVFRGSKGTVFVSRGYIRSEPESILETRFGPDDTYLGRGREHREDWFHCIRTREKPIADVEIGHRTNSICQLGNISFALRRPLKWDPADERFIGDDEANRMVSRAGRSPWQL